MDYLYDSTPVTGVLDWMNVRAKTVKTNNLILTNDNNGTLPTITGLPATRTLISRYRNTSTPHSSYVPYRHDKLYRGRGPGPPGGAPQSQRAPLRFFYFSFLLG